VIFTALVGDGRQGKMYIATRQRNIPQGSVDPDRVEVVVVPKKGKIGTDAFVQWMRWAKSTGLLVRGDVLLYDAETALGAQEVYDTADDLGVRILALPPHVGFLLNPCDNTFRASLKLHFYQSIRHQFYVSEVQRLNFAVDAYYATSEASIRNMFALCGLTEGEPEEVAKRLLTHGALAEGGWADYHEERLREYQAWRAQNHARRLDPCPLSLGDSALDGAHWQQWKTQHRYRRAEL
jgi:hypothetical protein